MADFLEPETLQAAFGSVMNYGMLVGKVKKHGRIEVYPEGYSQNTQQNSSGVLHNSNFSGSYSCLQMFYTSLRIC